MDKTERLDGQAAIVTGAGNGLGRAFALRLAASGAAVVVNNRWVDRAHPSSADAVVAAIRSGGGRAVAHYGSVEDPASGESLVAQAMQAFGRLDIVIANAGVPQSQTFRKQSMDDFKRVFDINFYGCLYLIHAAWNVLLEQGYGRIMVNASSAGLHSNPGQAAYSASKSALIGLVRTLSQEGERRNVLVNALAPYAATNMTTPYLTEADQQLMSPEHAAPLANWLASSACDVTGRTLLIGMGRIAAGGNVEGNVAKLAVDDVRSSVHAVLDLTPGRRFANANEAFAAFRVSPI